MAALTLAAAPTASPPSTAPAGLRDISVDVNDVRGPRSLVYKQCVGAGRVGEGLRAEWQAQLKVCRDEIGFEQLRCHGLFPRRVGRLPRRCRGRAHLQLAVRRPGVRLPALDRRPALRRARLHARGRWRRSRPPAPAPTAWGTDPAHPDQPRRITVFQWRANVTPPKDMDKWKRLVSATVRHWTDRYGADEVKRWHFEVWNEPNHPSFFSPVVEAHRADEYLALYAATAHRRDGRQPCIPRWRAGGGGDSIRGPADRLRRPQPPAARLHLLPRLRVGRRGRAGLDEFGKRQLYLKPAADGVSAAANSQNALIARSAKPHLPVNLTEWSTSYSARDPVHDDYLSAPYILEQLRHTESLASMSYWTFTDIFEETGIPPRPFHGGVRADQPAGASASRPSSPTSSSTSSATAS